jgi:membrane associated rhomboid family serine protease
MEFGSTSRSFFPPVVKNLLIINGLMFLVKIILDGKGIDASHLLGIHYFQSDFFEPWQILTHLFMHGSTSHLIFNMFALWMFGRNLEIIWGSKRFFNFYFLTAFGAMLLYYLVVFIRIQMVDPAIIEELKVMGGETFWNNYTTPGVGVYSYLVEGGLLLNTPAVGASGAIYGLLGATYALFPNTIVYLYFAIPVKMKWLTLGLATVALYMGLTNSGDNTAHFAHLGGLLAGILIVKYWNKTNRNSFY